MRDHILLYDKGGTPLYPKQSDSPVTTPGLPAPSREIGFCDLFAPIIPDANAHVGLRRTRRDAEGHKITVKNGYGINCGPADRRGPAARLEVECGLLLAY